MIFLVCFLTLFIGAEPLTMSAMMDRRTAILTAGVTAFIPSSSNKLTPTISPNDRPSKTVVLTGASSGIGYEALKSLITRRDTQYTIICPIRNKIRIDETKRRLSGDIDKILGESTQPLGSVLFYVCDLKCLGSVRSFCEEIGNIKIDVLALNAGIARGLGEKAVERTAEGFETTWGVNHLAHFLMAEILLSNINKQNGRVVITASSVHDPKTAGGKQGSPASLGNLDGLKSGRTFDMVDGKPFNPDKAYKDSKLCNILFAQELAERLKDSESTITVNCFSPGLIFSGLFREQNQAAIGVFNVFASKLVRVSDDLAWGGSALTYMMESAELKGISGRFYSATPGSSNTFDSFGEACKDTKVSEEALDERKRCELFDLTQELLDRGGDNGRGYRKTTADNVDVQIYRA